jgi:protoporphyrinogen oxidase
VYFSERYRPLTISRSELTSKVLIDLRRTGFIQERDEILMANSVECRYANVIYDNDRSAALDIIRSYLRSTGIHCCGRYGAWDHAWTDQAFMSGDAAARQILAD